MDPKAATTDYQAEIHVPRIQETSKAMKSDLDRVSPPQVNLMELPMAVAFKGRSSFSQWQDVRLMILLTPQT